MLFELNNRYYPYVFYQKNLNICSKSKILKKLSFKLQNLIIILNKTFIIYKIFKNKPIIKELNLKAMF